MNGYEPVRRREIVAWAMFDFANSGFTTVVLTAIFNAYFVSVIAGQIVSNGNAATLLWTITTSIAYLMVLASAPVIGAIADYGAHKKRFLVITSLACIGFTVLLATAREGDIALAVFGVIMATFMFAAGESLISAFLPELVPPEKMGRISGYGWAVGYLGGLLVLALCLVYIESAKLRGLGANHYVSVSLMITAASFLVGALPSYLWLRERAQAGPPLALSAYVRTGFFRLGQTMKHVRHYRDLFRFLIILAIFYCGIYIVVTLAAVYAQQVMGFDTVDNIKLILVVNITAAVGAFAFGHIQDRLGSIQTLALTLLLWIAALVIAYYTHDRVTFWIAANIIGVAMGSSQSAGRALVGQFSPASHSAEFFGLWSMATKLAAVVGPLSYGAVTYITGDHRQAILVTTGFFVAGLLLLFTIDEQRGRQAATKTFA
ncbi:MAG: MFS transporter [Gammaproteobacteria bacterium]|nr:MFS transporter [Gammaproteobacteria bacterium]